MNKKTRADNPLSFLQSAINNEISSHPLRIDTDYAHFSNFFGFSRGQAGRQSIQYSIIITDQQHANMLSSAGNLYLKTSDLEKLAKTALVSPDAMFKQNFV